MFHGILFPRIVRDNHNLQLVHTLPKALPSGQVIWIKKISIISGSIKLRQSLVKDCDFFWTTTDLLCPPWLFPIIITLVHFWVCSRVPRKCEPQRPEIMTCMPPVGRYYSSHFQSAMETIALGHPASCSWIDPAGKRLLLNYQCGRESKLSNDGRD